MHSVTSNAVYNYFLDFSRYIKSEIFPSELGFQVGETVDIADFTNAICHYLHNGRACVNLHFVWAYAESIGLNVNGTIITSAGITIIGNITTKEPWTNQHFLLLTDGGNTFRINITIAETLNSLTVRLYQINGSLI